MGLFELEQRLRLLVPLSHMLLPLRMSLSLLITRLQKKGLTWLNKSVEKRSLPE